MATNSNVVIVTQYTTVPAQGADPTPTPIRSLSSKSFISSHSTSSSLASISASSTSSTLSTSRISSPIASSTAQPPSSTPTHAIKDPPASPSPLIFLYLAVSLLVLAFTIYGVIFIIMICRGRCSNCAAVEAQNRKLLSGERVDGIKTEEFRAAEGRRGGKRGEFIGMSDTMRGLFGKIGRDKTEQGIGTDIDAENRISTQTSSYPYFNTTVDANPSTKEFGASRETFSTFGTQFANRNSAAPSARTNTFSAQEPRDSYIPAPNHNQNLTADSISPSIYSTHFNRSTASLYRSPEAAPRFTAHSSIDVVKQYPELEGIPSSDPDYMTYLGSKAIAENENDSNHKAAQAHANAHLRAMRKRHPLQRQSQDRGQRVQRVGAYGGFEDVPL